MGKDRYPHQNVVCPHAPELIVNIQGKECLSQSYVWVENLASLFSGYETLNKSLNLFEADYPSTICEI